MSRMILIVGWLMTGAPASAQQDASFELFVEDERLNPAVGKEIKGATFTLAVEVFSVPLERAAAMRRASKDDRERYDALVAAIPTGQVRQERLFEVRGVENEPVAVEEIREYLYPTEFDPPRAEGLPAKLPADFKDVDKLIMPAMPAVFQHQDLGDWVEGNLQQNPDVAGGWIGTLNYRHVYLEKPLEYGEEAAKVILPQFRTQKITATVKLKVGKVKLVGSFSDPSSDEEQEEALWMVFVSLTTAEGDAQ